VRSSLTRLATTILVPAGVLTFGSAAVVQAGDTDDTKPGYTPPKMTSTKQLPGQKPTPSGTTSGEGGGQEPSCAQPDRFVEATMRTWLIILMALGLLCALGYDSEALAIVRKGSGPAPNKTTSKMTPLSVDECTGLGGEVKPIAICNSGQACRTTDQSGKVHYVCISASQK
jgi:hypothetical protein